MYEDCEIAEFYAHREPIARKKHKCVECGCDILQGEKYFKAVGKWSYGFATYRQHVLCEKACEYIRDHLNGFECIGFGSLFDWCSESGYLSESKDDEKSKVFRAMIADILKRKRGT